MVSTAQNPYGVGAIPKNMLTDPVTMTPTRR
jgi:hypothetical protein